MSCVALLAGLLSLRSKPIQPTEDQPLETAKDAAVGSTNRELVNVQGHEVKVK